MVITETQEEDYWFFKLNMEIYMYYLYVPQNIYFLMV